MTLRMELFYQRKQGQLSRIVQSIQFLIYEKIKKEKKFVREVRVCDSKVRCREDIIILLLNK
jgi:hypothetical protein